MDKRAEHYDEIRTLAKQVSNHAHNACWWHYEGGRKQDVRDEMKLLIEKTNKLREMLLG